MNRSILWMPRSIGLMLLMVGLTVSSVEAQGPPAKVEPYPIMVGVGEAVDLCATGTMMCPAYDPICDNIAVATMRRGDKGLEIVGVQPGKTLCSASSANFVRVLFAVTVR